MNAIIKKYEGFESDAYLCPKGYWTIGYGNRFYEDGTEVKQGDSITEDQAEELLNFTITKMTKDIDLGFKLTNNQRLALESLVFNVGTNSFINSKCCWWLKQKNFGLALKEWNWGCINNLNGLTKRRAEEIYLFFTGIK